MKRRENMRSSSTSSHRETTPENHLTKNIGCISGLFHLVSKYQYRRKFITSASKEEKRVNDTDSPLKQPKPLSSSTPENSKYSSPSIEKSTRDPSLDDSGRIFMRRLSCDELRSPTLPSKIRLSSNDDSSPRSLPRSPAIIARLMGLDEIPAAASPSPVASSEKRRKLMEALEKCDEDLKVLKNIIETIRETETSDRGNVSEDGRSSRGVSMRKSSTTTSTTSFRSESDEARRCEVVKDIIRRSSVIRRSNSDLDKWLFDVRGDDSIKKETEKCSEFNSSDDQPSPVSVLDVISDSPPWKRSTSRCSAAHQIGENKSSKKPREESTAGLSRFRRITCEALPRVSIRKGNDVQCGFLSNQTLTFHDDDQSSIICKAAKAESVNEVCMDGVWAERWEVGRIGVALEDHIFKMLVEETVRELGCGKSYISSSSSPVLPSDRCRKRLLF